MSLLSQGFKVSQAEEISKVTGRFLDLQLVMAPCSAVLKDLELLAKFTGNPPVTD